MPERLAVIGEALYEIGLDGEAAGASEGFGGDAANTAVMAALLGTPALLIGRVGDDALGRRLVRHLERRRVDTAAISVDRSRPTGIYVNSRTPDGHVFDYHRSGSAGSALEPDDTDTVDFTDVGVIHYTGIGLSVSKTSAEACRHATERAAQSGARISFAANVRHRLHPNLDDLRSAALSADIVFLSEEDAEALFGSIPAASQAVADAETVITQGAHGAVAVVGCEQTQVAPPPVKVVDAAGAGDALAGAYLALRLRGSDVGTALRYAVTAAALSCERSGCSLAYPTASVVEACLSSSKGATV